VTEEKDGSREPVESYDEKAEAVGWYGPEIVFGLAYASVRAGESILDIGIGTGLSSALFRRAGLAVHGMDHDPAMLEACRKKGFGNLTDHDLRDLPYPYEPGSMDHALCLGVFHFFSDPSPILREAARIIRPGGLFLFTASDRDPEEPRERLVGPEHTGTDRSVTIYRHGAEEIVPLLDGAGFTLRRELAFTIYIWTREGPLSTGSGRTSPGRTVEGAERAGRKPVALNPLFSV